nr:copia protein [Tanacetum cinerariifolium]
TKTINTIGPVNTATLTYADYPNDPLMPNLKDAEIFDDAYDDRDEGVEADYNNLETVISVSPIPSTRIHKDHPKEHIIGEGHRHEEGIDYDGSFAQVARIEAIKLFLAYASFMDFTVHQMDVKSTFLYGTMEEDVYVSQPLDFVDLEFPDKVYKVEKALYGLHQAPRAWSLSNEFEHLMHKRFQISSMGELTFFPGLQVKQRKEGIFLSQDKYVSKILKKFGFSSVKSASTPMETHKPLSKDENGTDVDVYLYRLISWQCKKQTVVANSTTEVEYIAASKCCKQVLWLQNQSLDYGYNFMQTKINMDNETTIYVVKHHVYH